MSPLLCICCSFLLRSPSLEGFLKFHFRRPRIRLVVTAASSNLPPLCFHMLAAAAPLAHSEEEEEEKSRRGRYSFISRAAGGPFCRCRSSPPLPPLSLSLSLSLSLPPSSAERRYHLSKRRWRRRSRFLRRVPENTFHRPTISSFPNAGKAVQNSFFPLSNQTRFRHVSG